MSQSPNQRGPQRSPDDNDPINLDLQPAASLSIRHTYHLEAASPMSTPVEPEPKTELEETTANLTRMLSINSVLSTTSSAAERDTAEHGKGERPFRQIGAGTCGVIFAQDGASIAIKLAKNNAIALWNDYVQHKKIATQFRRLMIEKVQIPACYFFVPKKRSEWWENYPGLTEAAEKWCNLPTCALLTERIDPLPKPTRTAIIEKYCKPKIKQEALAAPGNNDCLVRVYLGSAKKGKTPRFFNLRNFKLYLNRMVELRLDVDDLARRMGVALAVMHWAARTDANDVEFVLGSSSSTNSPAEDDAEDPERMTLLTYTGPPSNITEDFFNRRVKLWVLDFDKVRNITMDDAGVAQAARAFMLNAPYFPRPCRESEVETRIWEEFVEAYRKLSLAILRKDEGDDSDYLELPEKFISKVIEAESKKLAKPKD
ncbi:zinc finger protein-domain-containing protein [Chaetomium strumarium]|uniref:Zinc finger protein-domain-containing protein n=1 Tax=Chaetomium strumarium TaxID=1170767 RepID=A0AAJ0M2E3_9PEZI|nr:zinc finger protein-domain-containing protein [Chaetomium strumarium]